MTRPERNTRAVELWLQSRSWRGIASQLSTEGFGAVSHQYIARLVKRELSRAWQSARYVPTGPTFQTVQTSQKSQPIAGLVDLNDLALLEHDKPPQPDTLLPESPATSPTTELIVESFFNARHFVVLNGKSGVPHGHSYRARLMATGVVDPTDGIIIGFADAQAVLDEVVMHFAEELLNRLDEFSDTQPTTENVALSIAKTTSEKLQPDRLVVTSVTLWESPTKGVTVTMNSRLPGQRPRIIEAGDQPFIST